MKPLTEQEREQISVEELMRLLFRHFKERQQKEEREPIPKFDVLYLLTQLCPIPPWQQDVSVRNLSSGKDRADWIIRKRSTFAMKFLEAIALLQKRGLIAPVFDNLIFLTSIGQQSVVEDDIILLVDDAETIVQSVRDEVSNLDSTVADYYRESIRAYQEGLLFSSCICLGASSETAIYRLAESIPVCDSSYQSRIDSWIKRRDMSGKIDTLWQFVNEIHKDRFPNEPCFKDLRPKLRHLADWYCITRNEAAHPDREAILPTQEEIDLSIRQFRRYVINIFQIVDLFQSASQNP